MLNYIILSGAAVEARVNADGSIELIDAVGNSRPATGDEIASAKRMQLRDEINAERERRETLGFIYTFPDGSVGTIQMRNLTDFRNINGLISAATILVLQAVTDPVLKFSDAENVTHDLTPNEMLFMGIAVQQRVSALYAAAAAIKANLAGADPDQFDINQGWPE